jgi:uncharacterized protein YukE
MAKAVLKKAAKDYPESGINKGDNYYFAQIKTGPRSSRTIRSRNPIPRSQLTTSSFKSQLYDIEDTAFYAVSEASDLRDIAERVRELGQEAQESLDNMPEGLQQGDTGQLLEERVNAMDGWADDIESTADELESELQEFDDEVDAYRTWLNDPEQDENEEPDLPGSLSADQIEDDDAVQGARQELIDAKAQEAADANPGVE